MAAPLPIRRYSPEPIFSHPVKMARSIASDLWQGRELAWRLFLRDFSAQYRQSYLGYFWAFLPPLVNSFIFVMLNSLGMFKTGSTGIPYAAFAMMGTLLWQGFADSLAMPLSSLMQGKPMLTKINFPRETLIISGLLMVLCNFLIRLTLIGGVMLWFRITPGWSLLFFPVAATGILLAGTSIGLLIAPLGGLFGDVGRTIPMITSIWMLLTPVVYPVKSGGLAGILAAWNPASPLILTAREALTGQPLTHLVPFACVFVASLLLLLVAWIGFRITLPHLIARMGG